MKNRKSITKKCSKLLFKLITQVCDHYETRYGTNGMQNTIMMYKRDIGNKIYKQMLQHFYCENGFFTGRSGRDKKV